MGGSETRTLYCRHCHKPTRHELRLVGGVSNGKPVILRVWCCVECGAVGA